MRQWPCKGALQLLYPAPAAYKKTLLPSGWTSACLKGAHSHGVGMAVAIHKVQELGLVRAVIDLGKDLFVQSLAQVYDSCGALSSCTLCMVTVMLTQCGFGPFKP